MQVGSWYHSGSNCSDGGWSAGRGSGERGQGWWRQDQGRPPVRGPGMPPFDHLSGTASVGFVQVGTLSNTAAVDGPGGCLGGRGRHVAFCAPRAHA